MRSIKETRGNFGRPFFTVICGIRVASARPNRRASFCHSATVKTETDGNLLGEGLETVRVNDGESAKSENKKGAFMKTDEFKELGDGFGLMNCKKFHREDLAWERKMLSKGASLLPFAFISRY